MRILIAEDNDTDAMLLQRHLRKLWPQCECTCAARRSELEPALAQSWDIIISDYHLLDIEGDELLARIAATQPNTPCLLLSGSLYEILDIDVPHNVFAKLEKGDHAALDMALATVDQ